jgi:transposase
MINNNQNIVSANSNDNQKADRVLIGVDTHSKFYVVCRQFDAQTPQAPQRLHPIEMVSFASKQLALAHEVCVIYEAGPFGFGLARELIAQGINCLVAVPKKLDPYSRKVRTDKTDVRELVSDLDRYLRGNKHALRVVRIPTLEEEVVRARNRQRDALCREQRAMASRGRTLLLQFGEQVSNHWWKEKQWVGLASKNSWPKGIAAMLERYRTAILNLKELIEPLEKVIVQDAPEELPRGMGKLTFCLLLREVMNWQRFQTRRQVGGFTGLCGGVLQSGNTRLDTKITKVGHKRIRTLLVELAWRMLRYQPDCALIRKWAPRLAAAGKNKSRRKQIVVAIARQLAIDIWKWQTGRTTSAALAWKMVAA